MGQAGLSSRSITAVIAPPAVMPDRSASAPGVSEPCIISRFRRSGVKAEALQRMREVMQNYMAYAVLFQDAVARRAGVNATDPQSSFLSSL